MDSRTDSLLHALGRGVGAFLSSESGKTSARPASRAGRREARSRDAGSNPRGRRATELTEDIAGVIALSLFRRYARRIRPSPSRLIRGAIAGAGAAGALLIYRILAGSAEEGKSRAGKGSDGEAREVIDELLAGAGRGIVYASLLAPLLPAPPPLRGAIAGTVEYLTVPFGGLYSRLQALAPFGRMPLISLLLEIGDAEDDPYVEFLIQGVVMGAIYGRDPIDV
jgi:hypothetical protein